MGRGPWAVGIHQRRSALAALALTGYNAGHGERCVTVTPTPKSLNKGAEALSSVLPIRGATPSLPTSHCALTTLSEIHLFVCCHGQPFEVYNHYRPYSMHG